MSLRIPDVGYISLIVWKQSYYKLYTVTTYYNDVDKKSMKKKEISDRANLKSN